VANWFSLLGEELYKEQLSRNVIRYKARLDAVAHEASRVLGNKVVWEIPIRAVSRDQIVFDTSALLFLSPDKSRGCAIEFTCQRSLERKNGAMASLGSRPAEGNLLAPPVATPGFMESLSANDIVKVEIGIHGIHSVAIWTVPESQVKQVGAKIIYRLVLNVTGAKVVSGPKKL
jgi:hypothetical protein